MYKQGDLIAVDGIIYEYVKYDDVAKVHLVSEVGIDCDGIPTSTHILSYFYPEQLADGNNKIDLTAQQWLGLTEHLLRQDYDLTEEEIEDAADDIVIRCFATKYPKFDELADYIAEYMDR